MKGFAISSDCAEAPITLGIMQALAKGLARVEKWWKAWLTNSANPAAKMWGCAEHVDIQWSDVIGDKLPDADGYVAVRVVEIIPDAPSGVIAYHTVEHDRPLCLISWAAIQAGGGTLTGPDGLLSALSHEVFECRIDPTCLAAVPLPGNYPQGTTTPLEVCDWVQGSDYEEAGSEGYFLANSCTPWFFELGVRPPGRGYDTRSDVALPAVTEPFQETRDGYHEVTSPNGTTSQVYGDQVPERTKIRLEAHGPRGGAIKAARKATGVSRCVFLPASC